MNVIKKIFGSSNDRYIKSLNPLVYRINELENEIKKLSDADLKAQTTKFKQRLKDGETLDDLLPEAFATVREASVRTLGMRHYDVQLIGGITLHQGKIAEMKTGEGKTLVATLAAYLNALTERGVHVVTVNDYLARRDAEWMSKLYNFLNLTVGVVYSNMEQEEKQIAYRSDITYGQNNEFGFDYLRDNMKYDIEDVMQREHAFAIVDEVDSILIDEARTPLIISGPAEDSSEFYIQSNAIIPKLKEGEHYEIELRSKQPTLTEEGVREAERLLGVENLYDPNEIELLHAVGQSLKAHTTMEMNVDYVIREGKIVIVDEFTGRLMSGRRWSDGLHQAIEAKEGVKIQRENQTLASITFQNFFRLYDKLSGMTGTAATEAAEFKDIYKLDCVVIPTNKPLARDDQSDVIFRTRNEKYQAVCEDILETNKTGQPILVGTISIEQSEAVSDYLTKNKIAHSVLNAKQHEKEAHIIAQAGRLKSVTIATNMAGRGTDIVLGGNPEELTIETLGYKDLKNEEFLKLLKENEEDCRNEKKKVLEAGGLFIMGTERHESRRIDNQLRGRAGRQGDPGLSRFYVSLEDDLMKRFGGDRLQGIMKRLGWEEGAAIDGSLISRSIEGAQEKVERLHYESRKQVTEYDDVMNKQREVVYSLREKILKKENLKDEILNMIDDLLEDTVMATCDESKKAGTWDIKLLTDRFTYLFNVECYLNVEGRITQQEIFNELRDKAKNVFIEKATQQTEILKDLKTKYSDSDGIEISISGESAFDFEYDTFIQNEFLQSLDHFWNSHLRSMDHLRDGIGLRGYGQKNPLHEYQREGFVLFNQMIASMQENIVRSLCHSDVSEMDNVLKQFKEEQERRNKIEKTLEETHKTNLENDNNAPAARKVIPKDANSEKSKLEEQKKARRKKKNKK